jgi:thiol-disulfide isomerase/thioredoxin
MNVLLRILTMACIASTIPACSTAEHRSDSAFGFPHRDANVLCDTADLRLSAWNNSEVLFVQAVLRSDGDDSVGETDDGREIGDWSSLLIDCDADGKATANVDRSYALNPWPSLPGLRYSVVMSESGSTGLKGDSKGRGAISYLPCLPEGDHKVRVDTYLIPLSEIARKPGETVHLAFWASSVKPAASYNSLGIDPVKAKYSHSLPREKWHALTLSERSSPVDESLVPDPRSSEPAAARSAPVMPKLGASGAQLPEVAADSWLNWSGEAPPTIASLKGKVVVVEFWATWCGPCVKGIPHLNQLHEAHASEGLVILSLTDQSQKPVEAFMTKTPMKYVVGVKSDTGEKYGVVGIPHAAVIGRDGVLLWQGNPQSPQFDETIVAALKKP